METLLEDYKRRLKTANEMLKDTDRIARNPKNHDDQWLVAKAYFEDNLEPIE